MFQDKSVREDVIRELDWEPTIRGTEIGVGVKDGIVTLSGLVESHAAKRAGEKAAARVHGVRAVSSQLEVEPVGPADPRDGDIAWAAANTLTWNALVPQERITISVTHGWITLEGAVERRFQRMAAEDAVADLAGVVGVTNLIAVRPTMPAQELKQAIEAALTQCSGLNTRRVVVEMEGDCARLWGCVGSLAERESAERAAWSVSGLRELSNHLTVESHEQNHATTARQAASAG